MANLFAADGAVSPARAAAPAQDARQRVDPVTAVVLPAANRRADWRSNADSRDLAIDGTCRIRRKGTLGAECLFRALDAGDGVR